MIEFSKVRRWPLLSDLLLTLCRPCMRRAASCWQLLVFPLALCLLAPWHRATRPRSRSSTCWT
jgi:hypothetical protein